MRRLSPVLIATVALVAACANPGAPSGSGASEDLPAVVAEVAGIQITAEDMKSAMAAQEYQHDQQLYRMRQQWIENEVVERLLEREAKKAGTDVDGLLAKIDSEARIATDADAQMFYKVQSQQGRIKDPATGKIPPFEDLKDRIKEHLTEQSKQAARQQYFAKLLDGQEPKVNLVAPEPPKVSNVSPGDDPVKGPEDAVVTVVEFSDFQCPACRQAHFRLPELFEKYGDKIKFVYRDFPLLGKHPDALPAAIAAQCAGDQGKYWEMHDKLFKSSALKADNFKTLAGELSLDMEKFDACLKDPAREKEVRDDLADGRDYGVGSTPTFYVNGYLVVGADIDEIGRLIERELEKS